MSLTIEDKANLALGVGLVALAMSAGGKSSITQTASLGGIMSVDDSIFRVEFDNTLAMGTSGLLAANVARHGFTQSFPTTTNWGQQVVQKPYRRLGLRMYCSCEAFAVMGTAVTFDLFLSISPARSWAIALASMQAKITGTDNVFDSGLFDISTFAIPEVAMVPGQDRVSIVQTFLNMEAGALTPRGYCEVYGAY